MYIQQLIRSNDESQKIDSSCDINGCNKRYYNLLLMFQLNTYKDTMQRMTTHILVLQIECP